MFQCQRNQTERESLRDCSTGIQYTIRFKMTRLCFHIKFHTDSKLNFQSQDPTFWQSNVSASLHPKHGIICLSTHGNPAHLSSSRSIWEHTYFRHVISLKISNGTVKAPLRQSLCVASASVGKYSRNDPLTLWPPRQYIFTSHVFVISCNWDIETTDAFSVHIALQEVALNAESMVEYWGFKYPSHGFHIATDGTQARLTFSELCRVVNVSLSLWCSGEQQV